jgi:hypothetical protein
LPTYRRFVSCWRPAAEDQFYGSFDTLLPLLSGDPGPFKPGTLFVEPHFELVLGRQLELVARHEHIAIACGCEAHNLGITFRAEQNPNGWILLRIGNMLGQVIDVEAKLPRMLRAETLPS